jgi:hypothetical protein
LGIDIGWHINAKLNYNASRPRLHGKTYWHDTKRKSSRAVQ